MTETNPQAEVAPRAARSALLLAIYVAIVAWMFYEQATSWPHEGHWSFLVLLFLCPGIVFQAFNLAYMRVRRRPLARRMLARVVTIPLGLVLVALLQAWASALSMSGFVEAYAALVARVGANPASACGQDPKHFAIPAVVEYNRRTGRGRPDGRLAHDGRRFVLSYSGGSADIDGSTFYYDSNTKAWTKFHNDDRRGVEALEKLTAGLAGCTLRAP